MKSSSSLYVKFFFPSYFRIVGLVLIVISIMILVFAAFVKTYLDFIPAAHFVLMYNRLSFVLGLSLVIFSKEKVESEETQEIRLNAFIFSLAAAVFLLLFFELVNMLNNNEPVQAVDFIIIEMCVYYLFFKLKN